MNPIVFLDIDGVLNCKNGVDFPSAHSLFKDMSPEQWRAMVMPSKVALLNDLVDRVDGVKFVLSSTWRAHWPYDEMQKVILEPHGFKGELIGQTEQRMSSTRIEEIAMYLFDLPELPAYVILDDDRMLRNLKDFPKLSVAGVSALDRWIPTDFETGLQAKHVDAAVQILLT